MESKNSKVAVFSVKSWGNNWFLMLSNYDRSSHHVFEVNVEVHWIFWIWCPSVCTHGFVFYTAQLSWEGRTTQNVQAQEALKRSNRDLAPDMPVFARQQRAYFLCTLLDSERILKKTWFFNSTLMYHFICAQKTAMLCAHNTNNNSSNSSIL